MRGKFGPIALGIVGELLVCTMGCTQKMGNEGTLRVYESQPRKPPDGTVARGHIPESNAATLPKPVTRAFLDRGRNRFGIYCTPCHGMSGYGDGRIVQRGFLAPPSYHTDRLRNVPDAHFFDVIMHGFGAMYSYSDKLEPADAWAIVAYIRALQLSQAPSLKGIKR